MHRQMVWRNINHGRGSRPVIIYLVRCRRRRRVLPFRTRMYNPNTLSRAFRFCFAYPRHRRLLDTARVVLLAGFILSLISSPFLIYLEKRILFTRKFLLILQHSYYGGNMSKIGYELLLVCLLFVCM